MLPHKNSRIGTPYKRRGRLWSLGWHTGDDWLTPTGTKALAMADGRVVSVGYNSAYGNSIIVESNIAGRRVCWSVNHLSRFSVKTGQTVRGGQTLGYTGATGNVTGPHDHVETRVWPFTFTPQAFIDPQVAYGWQPKKKARPAWATLRPKKAPKRVFRAVCFNVGGMNTLGRKTFRARAPKIVRDISLLGPDVVGIQELAGPEVEHFDRLMNAAGYRRCSGSDGRYIYRDVTIDRHHHGVFELKPGYDNNGNQAAWSELEIDGHRWLVNVGHLESAAGADQARVDQALSLISQAEAKAHDRGIPKSRIIYLVDTNSETWVRVQAFNERHYVDSAETAWKRSYVSRATFVGWRTKPKAGSRIDGIYVHRTRPVTYYTTRVKSVGLSDHLMIVADVGQVD